MPDHSKTTRPVIEKRGGEHRATGGEKASQNKKHRGILAQIYRKGSKRRTNRKVDRKEV